MNGCVYLLLSLKDRKTYLGSTNDLSRRLNEHDNGKCKSTMHRRPFKLIYNESFSNLNDARLRERYLKSRKGRMKLKEIFTSLNIGE